MKSPTEKTKYVVQYLKRRAIEKVRKIPLNPEAVYIEEYTRPLKSHEYWHYDYFESYQDAVNFILKILKRRIYDIEKETKKLHKKLHEANARTNDAIKFFEDLLKK